MKQLQKNKRKLGIYAKVVDNDCMPWMRLSKVPEEYFTDLKSRKNVENRYYTATIQSTCPETYRTVC